MKAGYHGSRLSADPKRDVVWQALWQYYFSHLVGRNDCVDDTVEAYLLDGVLPAVGATCPGTPIPPPVLVIDPFRLPGSDPVDVISKPINRVVRRVGR